LSYLDFGTAAALEWRGEAIIPSLTHKRQMPEVAAIKPHAVAAGGSVTGTQGRFEMALVVGLVSIALIWVVVIYGSIYVNKNVQ
jgi:hypothetical protein